VPEPGDQHGHDDGRRPAGLGAGGEAVEWVGDIQVSAQPLYSSRNTDCYRLFGDAHPEAAARH
jgi:hypothetical protein